MSSAEMEAQRALAAEDAEGRISVPSRIPEACRELALRHLEESRGFYYWLVLASDWRIVAASKGFQEDVLCEQGGWDGTFLGTLSPTLAGDLRDREENNALDAEMIELIHPTGDGSRAVAYRFYSSRDGWLLVGRDQSRQIEVASAS